MQPLQEKAHFLNNGLFSLLNSLSPDTKQLWGKMNAQQMVEHLSDSVRISSGKENVPVITPEEHITKYQDFLRTEKHFKENTPNVLMPDTPPQERNPGIKEAIMELKAEMDHFFLVFETDSQLCTTHPIFGLLDYDLSVRLLYKHAVHHLKQFGVVPEPVIEPAQAR